MLLNLGAKKRKSLVIRKLKLQLTIIRNLTLQNTVMRCMKTSLNVRENKGKNIKRDILLSSKQRKTKRRKKIRNMNKKEGVKLNGNKKPVGNKTSNVKSNVNSKLSNRDKDRPKRRGKSERKSSKR